MKNSENLKQKIAEIKAELDEEYYATGKKMFEALDKKSMVINALLDKLIEYRIKMHEADKWIMCSKCGAENLLRNNFCHSCGERMAICDDK